MSIFLYIELDNKEPNQVDVCKRVTVDPGKHISLVVSAQSHNAICLSKRRLWALRAVDVFIKNGETE